MKKIIIAHIITSLKVGGAEALIGDLLAHLDADIFTHYVIYFHHGLHVQRLQKMGIKTIQARGIISRYDPFFCWRLLRIIKKINPDVIHSSLWTANFLSRVIGRIRNIPVVSALHLQATLEAANKEGRVRALIDHYTSSWSAAIITVSDDIAHKFCAAYPHIDTRRVIAIKNGIDYQVVLEDAQHVACTREQLGLRVDHFVIGTVGRFIERKNQAHLIQAFAQLHKNYSHARLLLIGWGELEHQLRNQVQKLGLVHEIIFVINQPARGYYQLFDCFVLPSESEGLSIALLEAMCFGLPSVVTGVNGVHEAITHLHNGWVVSTGGIDQLSCALERLINDRNMADTLGRAALACVEKDFSIQRMVQAYADIFMRVAREQQA